MTRSVEAKREAKRQSRLKWIKNNPEKYAILKKRKRVRYKAKHKDKVNKYSRDWRARNIDVVRAKDRARKSSYAKYIDHNTYRAMLVDQKGLCAICKQAERIKIGGKVVNLSVDHHHGTGTIRELLCIACNSVLGFAHEDIAVLEAAIEYLRKHKRA